MNPLLIRQLHKHLPAYFNAEAEPWRTFLSVVSAAYDEMQKDRDLLEHTLEMTSDELTEANEKLRREAENRLKSLSQYYQQTMELQQGMILCFKKTERGFEHTLCRGQLARNLGWSPEKIEGKVLSEFLPAEQAAALQAVYSRAWTGEECTYEGTSIDGRLVYLAQLRPRREAGVVREVIVSCVEITALKNFECELKKAKELAEAASRAKSEFLAVMSHEVRTPLNAILGFAQLLQQSSNLTAEEKGWLSSIDTHGQLLCELMQNILDFSNMEAGRLALNERPVDLRRLLGSIEAAYKPQMAKRQLTFRLNSAPDLPEWIVADGDRLRQVLSQLLSNAIKFTPAGGITLDVCVVKREETSADRRWILRFEVRDTGIGIAPVHRDRIFKPFTQVDSSSTRAFGGTGLGLAICKRLAGALGGDIDYESGENWGSKFFFTISAAETAKPEKKMETAALKAR